jgi:hypothetical protein
LNGIKEQMNEKWNINKENDPDHDLEKKEFSFLYSLEKKNPFSTPADYFEENALTISVRLEVADKHTYFNGEEENSGLPENYFNELESKIKTAVELDGLKKQSFETPANYFEGLESDLRLKLLLEELKKQSFATPVAYFEENAEQLKTILWLAEFKKEAVFEVPENYFENFEERLRQRIDEKKEAKVIQLRSVFKLKYIAAAAALIGICFMTYFFLRSSETNVELAPRQLSAMDKKKIIANPGEYGIDENAIVEMLKENPELLASAEVLPDDVSAEAMNEIVLDKDVDVSTFIGEN